VARIYLVKITNKHYLVLAGQMLASLHSRKVNGHSLTDIYSIAYIPQKVNRFSAENYLKFLKYSARAKKIRC